MTRKITKEQMDNIQDVDNYLKEHGHLPNQECTVALCSESEQMECEKCVTNK